MPGAFMVSFPRDPCIHLSQASLLWQAPTSRHISQAGAPGTEVLSSPRGLRITTSGKTWWRRPAKYIFATSSRDALLEALNRGEFALNGLRNRDLRGCLFPAPADPVEQRRRTARISRYLALLRAHGLLRKVPHSHRYHLTPKGRPVITALLTARQADTAKLTAMAA
jgi:hypothetical protein